MKKFLNSLVLMSCALSFCCQALESDKEQAISFHADSADINHKSGLSYYHGHVMFDQGTTHIRADEGEVKINKQNQIIQAIAKSNSKQLAEYQTLPHPNEKIFYAKAKTIIWYAQLKKISLIDSAIVEQGKNSYAAPRIDYDIVQQHVVSAPSKLGNTIIRIYPEKKSS